MPVDLAKLTTRLLSEEEVVTVRGHSNKAQTVTWLAEQLKPIVQHTGIEIGPFDTENFAKSFNAQFTGEAVDELGWGKNGTGKANGPRTRSHVREREGKFYLWIVRLKE